MDVSFWIYGYYNLDIVNRLNDGHIEPTATQTDTHSDSAHHTNTLTTSTRGEFRTQLKIPQRNRA
jgi:hypothetical protein